MKRWNLVRVVNKNSEVDLAALRTAQEMVGADEQVAPEPTVDETTETAATATDSADEAPQPGESAETEEAADVNETEENDPAETEAEE